MKYLPRASISSFLTAFFFLLLLFLALFAEVFESNAPEIDFAQIYSNPIPINEIKELKSIKLINKHASFIMENSHPTGQLEGPWQIIEPQTIRVKESVISKIVEAFSAVRVRNFHRLEPINLSSFSLDNPTLLINFTTPSNKSYEIKIGLINPIDNSAYMVLSGNDQIYQIEPIELALENYDLSKLADAKILTINSDSLQSLELYQRGSVQLKLNKVNEAWIGPNGEVFSTDKVSKFFAELELMKSFSVLDKLSNDQLQFMQQNLTNPQFGVKIISERGIKSYLISKLKNKIPEMDVPVQDTYIFSSEEKKSFILINKDELKILNTKNSDLR